MDRLSAMVEAGLKYGVKVVFAVSPGLDIDYSSEDDVMVLVRKLSRVMELGIGSVAVFLDDIPPSSGVGALRPSRRPRRP
jgi:hyaluronoglucosaminidase